MNPDVNPDVGARNDYPSSPLRKVCRHNTMTDLDSRDWNSRASTGNPPTVPSTISTTLEELVATLESSGLPGPVLLSGVPEKIGSGSQFYVFKQKVVFMERNMFNDSDVAIKRPILPENKNTSFDLADQRVQRNLRHIQNEIRALTHVRLQNHPNIVKLLSWAIEDDWVLSFVLILELAPKDLEKFLKCFQPKDHLAIRFCQDVANGMDAIHEAGFIHGDLKPANVLVFPHGMRPVAKLSDFGFAGNNEATFGTKMWQAPEKTSSVEADRFSYGLLVWSVMLLNGDPPPNITSQSARKLALADLDKKREKMDESLFGTLREALCSLLEDDVLKRPPRLSDFFLETAEPLHTDQYVQTMNLPMETTDKIVARAMQSDMIPLRCIILSNIDIHGRFLLLKATYSEASTFALQQAVRLSKPPNPLNCWLWLSILHSSHLLAVKNHSPS